MEAKLIKNKYGDDFYYLMVGIDTYATTHKESFRILSLKNCEEIERGYNLGELAEKKYPYEKTEMFSCFELDCKQEGFIEGAKTILEILGDKKFSEEDIKNAMERVWYWHEDNQDKDCPTLHELIPKHIQSLQQTEWDVEIVMDICGDKVYAVPEPATDEDGCLILKRI